MGNGLNRQQRRAAERAQARTDEAQRNNSDYFAMVTVSGKIRVSARSHNDARRVLNSVYSQPAGTVEMLFVEEVLDIQEGVLSAEEDSLYERAVSRQAQNPVTVTVGLPKTRVSPADDVYNAVLTAGDNLDGADISGLIEAIEHAPRFPRTEEFKELLHAAAAFREACLKFAVNGHLEGTPKGVWDVIETRMNGDRA